MRVLFPCLLALLSSVAVASAAPAPFPKSRDAEPPLTAEQLTRHLSDHHNLTVERITPQSRRGEWIVVGSHNWHHYWGYAPSGLSSSSSSRVVFLVKFQ